MSEITQGPFHLLMKNEEQLVAAGCFKDEDDDWYEYEDGPTVLSNHEVGMVYMNCFETANNISDYDYTSAASALPKWAIERMLDPVKESMYFV